MSVGWSVCQKNKMLVQNLRLEYRKRKKNCRWTREEWGGGGEGEKEVEYKEQEEEEI